MRAVVVVVVLVGMYVVYWLGALSAISSEVMLGVILAGGGLVALVSRKRSSKPRTP